MELQNYSSLTELHLDLAYQNSDKVKLKTAWTDLAKNQKPTQLMTVTFKPNYSVTDDQATRIFNSLWYYTNTTIFRKKFKRGEDSLRGLAVLEHQAYGQPHIHAMIVNDLPFKVLESAVNKHISKFPMLNRIGIDVKSIRHDPKDHLHVAKYLQKEAIGFMILDREGLH